MPGSNYDNTSTRSVIELEEIPGTKYNDLQQAQTALRPQLARLLAEAIRQGIEQGKLKVINGKVQRNDS